MSDVQKLKKSNKKMSPETKATLSNVFKGLISNQACVDGGKDSPWWIALIFLCLSIILPLIPIMVSQNNVYGSQIFNGYNYSCDRGIHETLTTARDNGFEFTVIGGKMVFNKDGNPFTTTDEAIAVDKIKISESGEVYNFRLYITEKKGSELTNFVNTISSEKFESGTITPKKEDYGEDPVPTFYTPGFLIFTPDTMGLCAYKYNSTTVGLSSYGGLNWNHTQDGEMISRLLGADYSETLNNMKKVLDETFIDAKAVSFRTNTLIYFGVYTGLILFLGLMVFILTRGKSNIFNFLSFFKCQRIAWWAAFTPAVLGMIFAFIFSTNIIGQMSFVVFLALRVMWLSMKQLRPVQ